MIIVDKKLDGLEGYDPLPVAQEVVNVLAKYGMPINSLLGATPEG